ncbi:MAG: ribonuclease III [Paracoccaceae bacterium]|jgi:ribonuclease-3|nr:ribonuclease III [Paracoccaceae bacterium]MDG1371596.1 ribonuclease III [Paracoccaceae bacterium]
MGDTTGRTLLEAAKRLGHRFEKIGLLDRALTHPSISSHMNPDNQRLEFLGDRVLGLVIAEVLIERYPDEAEGVLAPRLNDLVRKETCAEVALAVGIDQFLRLGKSESQTGGRRKIAILGDAMEAVIAAVFLDAGLDAARDMILRLWKARIEAQGDRPPMDAKTALQEWAQANGMKPPRYNTVGREGPDHAPVFTIAVVLETGATAEAEAKSKRAAEQAAAAKLLESLEK